jgi:hypothetical protein
MSAAAYIQVLWYRRSFNLLALLLTPLSRCAGSRFVSACCVPKPSHGR